MTVAARARALSLDEAIEQGINAAHDGYGVAETAAKLWESGLDPDAADACGVIGLRTLIHSQLAAARHPVREEDDEAVEELDERDQDSGRPVANIHYAREHWQRLLAANYEAADGSRKALLAFTDADAAHLRTIANNRADGYLRLRDAMDAAMGLLKRHRKPTIADLPEKAQRQIAEALA